MLVKLTQAGLQRFREISLHLLLYSDFTIISQLHDLAFPAHPLFVTIRLNYFSHKQKFGLHFKC